MLAGAALRFDARVMTPSMGRVTPVMSTLLGRRVGDVGGWLRVWVGLLMGHRGGYTVVSCAGS